MRHSSGRDDRPAGLVRVQEQVHCVLIVQDGRCFAVYLPAELEQRQWGDRGLSCMAFGASARHVEIAGGREALGVDFEAELSWEREEG